MTDNLAQTIKLQQLASNPQNSAWVFASAGSGKTKVLTDRVLRLLLDGVKPDKILCLTFTKVAATEMQNRINQRLADFVLFDEEKLQSELFNLSGISPDSRLIKKARTVFAEILDCENKIKIQTIHSFCQGILRIFPFEAKINPNFELLEESQEKLLLQKAQKEVLRQATTNPQLRNLVIKINSQLHEESFLELILELLSKKEKLTELKEKFLSIDNIIAEIFAKFGAKINHDDSAIFNDFLATINKTDLLKLCAALDESALVTNKKIADKIRSFLLTPQLKNFTNLRSAFFTEKDEIRKINGKILEDPYFFKVFDVHVFLIKNFIEALNAYKNCDNTALLLRFTDQILENYTQLKKQNAVLDYDDLINETSKLLSNPNFADWVKMKMDGLFDHILVDESQDTNHQQWNIVKSLTDDFFSGIGASNKDRTIFIVGDEKQSIYSFQGAEANISEEIFSYFSEKLRDHPTQFHKIDLSNSFRSLPIILDAVDTVFSGENEKSAITRVSDFKGHKAIRLGTGYVEIWPQIRSKKREKIVEKNYDWQLDFNEQESHTENDFLAEIIAQKIKNWVENRRVLNGRQKPLEYSDFMILLRRRTDGFDKKLGNVFHKYRIPFGSSGKIKFSENLLIQDLIAASIFATSPHDDLNLAALLKSPLFSVSEEELLEICNFKNQYQTTIYKALQRIEKFNLIFFTLAELVKKSQEVNCFEFFYFLLSEQNRQKILTHFGSQAAEILDKFLLKTFDFCHNISPHLQKFLDFICKLDPEISLPIEKANQVIITTIHSAKGLQAPIVIIPDCCFDTNKLRSTKEKISWIDNLPIWCAAKADETALIKIARHEKKNNAKAENLRLLYVALTRAEDELYIAGSGNSSDSECWYDLVKNRLREKSKSEKFLNSATEKFGAEKFEIVDETLQIGVQELNYDNAVVTKNSAKPQKITKNIVPEIYKNVTSQPAPILQNQGLNKGKVIHKILEIFGKNYSADKNWLAELAEKILAKEENLTIEEKNDIRDKSLLFLNSEQFDKIFSGKIKCEVEISGNHQIKRIDLLIEKENEVLIIDYKSDETLPKAAPPQYLSQLQNYRNLVGKIYPHKKISSAILWIKFMQFEFVS